MKQLACTALIFWFTAIVFLPASVLADCATLQMDNGVRLDIPCADYEGDRFRVILDGYLHPDDPNGIYFAFSGLEDSTAAGSCAVIDDGLNMQITCFEWQGTIPDFSDILDQYRKTYGSYTAAVQVLY